MSTLLLLIRPGAVSYSGRAGGADDGLNTLGELQAQALGRRLVERSVAAIYTSPLRRAYQTAEILAGFLGAPVREDERLVEIDPGGRCGPASGEQVLAAAEDMAFSHPGQEVAVICHGGALSALIGHFLGLASPGGEGWPFTLDNCSLSVLELQPGAGLVRCLNDTSHLEGLRPLP